MQSANGFKTFNQAKISEKIGLSIGEGACRGFVVYWLICIVKKQEDGFWRWVERLNDMEGDEETPLLGPLGKSINLQDAYTQSADAGGLIVPIDLFTYDTLNSNGLQFRDQDSINSSSLGFLDVNQLDIIADKVTTSKNRYFILSIVGKPDDKGHAIGHAIGIKREYATFGKSDTVYIFDPNMGQFTTTGSAGVQNCLKQLPYQELNNKYVLRSFFHS